VFSVHGGSIGRAPDNDWVLPDPDRYISGHHATIDYRAGAYYLRDSSTNGVYVNQSEQPVGRGAPLRLYDGDELQMGDYVFQVSIVNVSRDGTDDSGDGGPRKDRGAGASRRPAGAAVAEAARRAGGPDGRGRGGAGRRLRPASQANDSISLELPELEVEHVDTQRASRSFELSAVSDSGFR
jgi:type VI secretion system FHA domain protein